MLEKIRQLAMEKLASVEEVDAFMAGFEKEALFNGNLGNMIIRGLNSDHVAKGAIGLGVGLLGAAIVKGVSSGASAIDNRQLRAKFDMSLAQVMSGNKIVKGAKPERTRDYAETIFKFAPHVASDPNLLGSILANAVLGESIDPQTIKTLVELEGRFSDNNRANPLPGIRV